MIVNVADSDRSQIIFFRILSILHNINFFLMKNKLSITKFATTSIHNPHMITLINDTLLKELPFTITNLLSIPQQKSTNLLRRFKFLFFYSIGWISCSVLVILVVTFRFFFLVPDKLALHAYY